MYCDRDIPNPQIRGRAVNLIHVYGRGNRDQVCSIPADDLICWLVIIGFMVWIMISKVDWSPGYLAIPLCYHFFSLYSLCFSPYLRALVAHDCIRVMHGMAEMELLFFLPFALYIFLVLLLPLLLSYSKLGSDNIPYA